MDNFEAEFNRWRGGGCKFDCHLCGKTFLQAVPFWCHFESENGHKMEKFSTGDYTMKVEDIQCKICNLEYPFEMGSVEHHLKEQHPHIALRDYFQTCVMENVVQMKSLKLEHVNVDPDKHVIEEHNMNLKAETSDIDWVRKDYFEPCYTMEIGSGIKIEQPADCNEVNGKGIKEEFDFDDVVEKKYDKNAAEIVSKGTTSRYSRRLVKKVSKKCSCCTTKESLHVKRPAHDTKKKKEAKRLAATSEKMALNEEHMSGAKKQENKSEKIEQRDKQTRSAPNKKYTRYTHLDWLNKCEYHCHSCDLKLTTYSKCYNHCVRQHQSTIGKMILGKKLSRTIARYHECFLCKTKVRNEVVLVSRHLRLTHKITIGDYHEQNSHKEGFAENDDKLCYPYKVFSHPIWMNACEYKCEICDVIQSSVNAIKRHVIHTHGRKEGGKPSKCYKRTLLKWHKCRICNKPVVRDGSSIAGHLSVNHKGMSTTEYDDKFCSQGEIDHTLDDQLNLCDKAIPSWVNRCVYSCNLCEHTTNSISHIHIHGVRAHNMTQGQYTRCKGSSLTVAKYHKCMICGKAIQNDNYILGKHFASTHNKTLAKYNAEFSFLPGFGKDDETAAPKMRNMAWIDKCEYMCTICKTTFNTYVKLAHHGRSVHQMSIKSFKEKGGFLRTKKEAHKCLICGAKIMNDTTTVKVHLKRAHDLHIHQYHDQYIEGSQEKTEERTKEKTEVKKPKFTCHWMNRCQYECRLCPHSCGSITMMALHGKKAHQMPLRAFRKCNGYERTLSEYHKCKICQTEVLNDRIYLRRHFQVSHNITFLQYAEIINRENTLLSWVDKCEYECQRCGALLPSYKLLQEHAEEQHQVPFEEFKKQKDFFVTKDVKHQCRICHKNQRNDRHFLDMHLTDAHNISIFEYATRVRKQKTSQPEKDHNVVLPSWSNHCTYKCVCSATLKGRHSLQAHIFREHKVSTKKWIDNIKEDHIEHHTCLLCQQKVLCDLYYLSQHMKKLHSLSFSKYVKQFDLSFSSNQQ